MNCQKCGNEMKKEDLLCSHCGDYSRVISILSDIMKWSINNETLYDRNIPNSDKNITIAMQKFWKIRNSVIAAEEFLTSKIYYGLPSEVAAKKSIYRAMCDILREKFGYKKGEMILELEEQKHVLENLNEATKKGSINEKEVQEISNSTDFKNYTKTRDIK